MSDLSLNNQLPQLHGPTPTLREPLKARLSVYEVVYHQLPDGSPETCLGDASRFERLLESNEQVYERRKVIGKEWEKLDKGWVEKVGLLYLRNELPRLSVNPTDEQKERRHKQVLELAWEIDGIKRPLIFVPPGEAATLCPGEIDKIYLRCCDQQTIYHVCLIPE